MHGRRRCREFGNQARGAAGMRQRGVDRGATEDAGATRERASAGCDVRDSHARPQPGILDRRHPDARARHRRQHGHLQPRQRHRAQAAAGHRAARRRPHLHRREPDVVAQLSGHRAAHDGVHRRGGPRRHVRRADDRQLSRPAPRRDDVDELSDDARSAGAPGPDVLPLRYPNRSRRAQRTRLAPPLRERSVARRPDDPAGWKAVRSDRHHAAWFSRRAAAGIRERVLASCRHRALQTRARGSRPYRIHGRRQTETWSAVRAGASRRAGRDWTDRRGTSLRWRRGSPSPRSFPWTASAVSVG